MSAAHPPEIRDILMSTARDVTTGTNHPNFGNAAGAAGQRDGQRPRRRAQGGAAGQAALHSTIAAASVPSIPLRRSQALPHGRSRPRPLRPVSPALPRPLSRAAAAVPAQVRPGQPFTPLRRSRRSAGQAFSAGG